MAIVLKNGKQLPLLGVVAVTEETVVHALEKMALGFAARVPVMGK